MNILTLNNKYNIYKIGLTGGICSGKSTISSFLNKQNNCLVIDLDKLTHKIYDRNPFIIKTIVTKINKYLISNNINQLLNYDYMFYNRKEIGLLCFNNKDILNILTNEITPEIYKLESIYISKIIENNLNLTDNNKIKYVFIEGANILNNKPNEIEINKLKYNEIWSVIADQEIIEQRFSLRNINQTNKLYTSNTLKNIQSYQANDNYRINNSSIVLDTNCNDVNVNLSKVLDEFNKLVTRL